MWEFRLHTLLHSSGNLEVYDACLDPTSSPHNPHPPKPESLSKSYIAKVYSCTDISQGDALLKEALQIIASPYCPQLLLVEVHFERESERCDPFTVTFMFEKQADQVPPGAIERNDSQAVHRAALWGYTKGAVLYNNENVLVTVCEAESAHFTVPVVVKSCIRNSLFELNDLVREAVHQRRAAHQHSCALLDVALKKSERVLELCLVLERMPLNLYQAIRHRSQPYSEREIFTCLREVGSALVHAKRLNIAHRDIKPANVLLSPSGDFKLADFGSSWEMKMRSVTRNQMAGTFEFMAPEVIAGDSRPFPADVYSLGMTLLFMATLGRRQSANSAEHMQWIRRLEYTDRVKGLLLMMTARMPEQRPTIDDIMEELDSIEGVSVVSVPGRKAVKVVLVSKKAVRPFDVETEQWGAAIPLAKTIHCDEYSAYTLVQENRFIVCGAGADLGKPCFNTAYQIEVLADQCTVEELPHMTQARLLPGVLHYNGVTYVFGGQGYSLLSTGEMLNSSAWVRLPGQMKQARANFTPCPFHSLIFLCGGQANTIEVFDTTNQEFCFESNLLLPEAKPTVAWIDGELLTVASKKYTTRVNLGKGVLPLSGSISDKRESVAFWANSSPVFSAGCVYWTTNLAMSVVRLGGNRSEEFFSKS